MLTYSMPVGTKDITNTVQSPMNTKEESLPVNSS